MRSIVVRIYTIIIKNQSIFLTTFRTIISNQYIAVLGLLLVLCGFFLSRAAISIGMVVLTINALFQADLKGRSAAFVKHIPHLLFMGFFGLIMLSGAYSENTEEWLYKLKTKLPFLVLPFAIFSIQPFLKKWFNRTLYLFILMVVAGSFWSMSEFVTDYKGIIERYAQGQVLPTPIHHIRFSLMVVLSLASVYYLVQQGFYWVSRLEKYVLLAIGFWLFLFLHILAVKSGLLVAYVVVFLLIVREVVLQKRYMLGVAGLGLMVALPIIGYNTVPTLKNKIDYFRWDLEQYFNEGEYMAEELSDSKRMRSYAVAIDVWQSAPVLGVGYGDIKSANAVGFEMRYPESDIESRLQAHNQYLYVAMGMGTIGLLFFVAMLFAPLFVAGGYKDVMVLSTSIVGIVSFLVEHSLETQIGTALYLTFVLLALHNYYLNGDD